MIAHNRPTVGPLELQAVERVISSGWLAQGREVELFENEVCEYLGLEPGRAVGVSSGTAALFLALWALGAKGKRVAIPAYSCAAVRNAVLMAGAEPEPVDVGEDSPNIDCSRVAGGSAQLAVLAQMFGVPNRIQLPEFAIPTIEDCAQSFGARVDGRPVGVNGTVGIFSFYATKMITSGGQGGMLVSQDTAVVAAVRDYREFDCRRDRKPRFNLQMTDLQAAVARTQLSRLDSFIERRREIDAQYRAAGLPIWPRSLQPGLQSNHYRSIMRTPKAARIAHDLRRAGIAAIVPIEDWELLDEGQSPRALSLTHSTLSLPIYPSLTDSAVAGIIGAVNDLQFDNV